MGPEWRTKYIVAATVPTSASCGERGRPLATEGSPCQSCGLEIYLAHATRKVNSCRCAPKKPLLNVEESLLNAPCSLLRLNDCPENIRSFPALEWTWRYQECHVHFGTSCSHSTSSNMEAVKAEFASAGVERLSHGALCELLQRICGGGLNLKAIIYAFLEEQKAQGSNIEVASFIQWLSVYPDSSIRLSGETQVVTLPEADDETADRVVKRLAHRSMTLRNLLNFMRRLPQAMPQYDPRRTRTVDVVWSVIVPETQERGCAYADLFNGDGRLPDKMVSHNWGNLFLHLVAAVFADALGIRDFWEMSALLQAPGGLDLLEAKLQDGGHLESTRWLCIFCVNQHISICNKSWGGLDSVTGIPYRECACTLPKVHTGSGCEMNKFDDMISLFKRENPGYMHVAAADEQLGLLSRIWVIAELAEVFQQSLPCRFLLYKTDLTQVESRTTHLDVRAAKASRPEDVDMILAKIEDKDHFNQVTKAAILSMSFNAAVYGMLEHCEFKLNFVSMNPRSRSAVLRQRAELSRVKEVMAEAKNPADVLDAWASLPEGSTKEGVAAVYEEVMKKAAREDQAWLFRAAALEGEVVKSEEALKLSVEMMWLFRSIGFGQGPVEVSGPATAEIMVRQRSPYLSACVVSGPERSSLLKMVEEAHGHMLKLETDRNFSMCCEPMTGRCGAFSSALLLLWFVDSTLEEPSLTLHAGLRDEVQRYEGEWAEASSLSAFLCERMCSKVGVLNECNRASYSQKAVGGLLALWLGVRNLEDREVQQALDQLVPTLQKVGAKLPDLPCCLLHPSAMGPWALRRFLGPSLSCEDVQAVIDSEAAEAMSTIQCWSDHQSRLAPALLFYDANLSPSNGVDCTVRPGRSMHQARSTCERHSLDIDLSALPSFDDIKAFIEGIDRHRSDDFCADQLLLAQGFVCPVNIQQL